MAAVLEGDVALGWPVVALAVLAIGRLSSLLAFEALEEEYFLW